MMALEKIYIIQIPRKDTGWEEIHKIAIDRFNCCGVEEFAFNENGINNIFDGDIYTAHNFQNDKLDDLNSYIEKQDESKSKFYFYGPNAYENSDNFLTFLKRNYSKVQFEYFEETWKDWNLEWKKHYRPINISSKLQIVPEWLNDSDDQAEIHKVLINPGMGFGTGEHETTYLSLKLMEGINYDIKSCLDFGCGSGILGIAAMKIKDCVVDFCDIDRMALENCLYNLQINFKNKISFKGCSLVSRDRFKADKKYSLVFANILYDVLVREKDLLSKCLAPKGHLIISGILKDQVQLIIEHYSKFQLIEQVNKGDWSALLFSN